MLLCIWSHVLFNRGFEVQYILCLNPIDSSNLFQLILVHCTLNKSCEVSNNLDSSQPVLFQVPLNSHVHLSNRTSISLTCLFFLQMYPATSAMNRGTIANVTLSK